MVCFREILYFRIMLKKIFFSILVFFMSEVAASQSEIDKGLFIYPRKVVVEEWTGTWCGMCVRGIVGMEYMTRTYGNENFIGLAVHCDDRMEIPSYKDFIDKFTSYSSFPGCTLNRKYILDPSKYFLENRYTEVVKEGSYGLITASATMPEDSDREIYVSASVEFSTSFIDADLRIAFVLLENEVGPYSQMNTYAGGYLGEMDGWENQRNMVYIKFDNVVRESTHPFGIEGSLPSEIIAGESYSFSTTLSLLNITDINNSSLVALLIDSVSGEIVNADRIVLTSASIDEIGQETRKIPFSICPGVIKINSNIKEGMIFTPDGQCIKAFSTPGEISLPPGIYIISLNTIEGRNITKKISITQ